MRPTPRGVFVLLDLDRKFVEEVIHALEPPDVNVILIDGLGDGGGVLDGLLGLDRQIVRRQRMHAKKCGEHQAHRDRAKPFRNHFRAPLFFLMSN